MLTLIRETFPLNQTDKRQQNIAAGIIHGLQRLHEQLKISSCKLNSSQKKQALSLLKQIEQHIHSL